MAETRSTSHNKLIPMKYSWEEINTRREAGLCIFCDEQETPDHHLKHRRLRLVMVDLAYTSLGDVENLDSDLKAEVNEVAEIEVKTEVATKSIEKLVHEAFSDDESTPQFQVPIANSEILKSIEPTEVNLGLENLESLVINENLEQGWVKQTSNKRFEVEDDVDRDQKVFITKICSAHQVFGKTSQHEEKLDIKKRAKGFKSWMFKFKAAKRKIRKQDNKGWSQTWSRKMSWRKNKTTKLQFVSQYVQFKYSQYKIKRDEKILLNNWLSQVLFLQKHHGYFSRKDYQLTSEKFIQQRVFSFNSCMTYYFTVWHCWKIKTMVFVEMGGDHWSWMVLVRKSATSSFLLLLYDQRMAPNVDTMLLGTKPLQKGFTNWGRREGLRKHKKLNDDGELHITLKAKRKVVRPYPKLIYFTRVFDMGERDKMFTLMSFFLLSNGKDNSLCDKVLIQQLEWGDCAENLTRDVLKTTSSPKKLFQATMVMSKTDLFCNDESNFVFEALSSEILKNTRYRLYGGINFAALQPVDVFKVLERVDINAQSTALKMKLVAGQVCDRMLHGGHSLQHRRKKGKGSKSWKFKFKQRKQQQDRSQFSTQFIFGMMAFHVWHKWKSAVIEAKMMGTNTKSLCNEESVYILEDLSAAILEKNQSQIYCGIDCDDFQCDVFRFWEFTAFDKIPLGRKVLTKGRKKMFYKSRRSKFKHRVASRGLQSGFEIWFWRLVIYKLGGKAKTFTAMCQCVDQLVKMESAKDVTQSQTFDPGIGLESQETLRSLFQAELLQWFSPNGFMTLWRKPHRSCLYLAVTISRLTLWSRFFEEGRFDIGKEV
ncbi:hypothetical protein ISN44_As06g023230 [Arabidopsis suecica]|uniref:Uncharacterized protein n=1 Tax=Arabidopsis suecica TaxID=45249 RepID=A0A8T2CIH6_ARASU|nr:hypothetical protein ISN44_As06g023230 [Arabidopsis suecica]